VFHATSSLVDVSQRTAKSSQTRAEIAATLEVDSKGWSARPRAVGARRTGPSQARSCTRPSGPLSPPRHMGVVANLLACSVLWSACCSDPYVAGEDPWAYARDLCAKYDSTLGGVMPWLGLAQKIGWAVRRALPRTSRR
jgi:hypothetical protein